MFTNLDTLTMVDKRWEEGGLGEDGQQLVFEKPLPTKLLDMWAWVHGVRSSEYYQQVVNTKVLLKYLDKGGYPITNSNSALDRLRQRWLKEGLPKIDVKFITKSA